EIEIALPDRDLTRDDITTLREAFEAEYRAQFARSVPGMTIEILNWSVRVASRTTPPRDAPDKGAASIPQPARHTKILCDVNDQTCDAQIHDRATLPPGAHIPGPSLIIEPQTTTYVSADFVATVAGDGTLILTRTEDAP
ncbi:MAG: hydantoinase/oxoprolinase family protein, partial [Pseudomonadota bacterium]